MGVRYSFNFFLASSTYSLLVQRLIVASDHTQSHTYEQILDNFPTDEVSSLITTSL